MVGTTHENFLRYIDSERAITSFPRNGTRQEGMEDGTVERVCCVRGFCKWLLTKFLACKREPWNTADRYTVEVKDGMIIRHLPRKVSGPSLDCRYRKRATPNNQLHFNQCTCYYFSFTLLFVVKYISCFFIFVVRINQENIFVTTISRSMVIKLHIFVVSCMYMQRQNYRLEE